MIGIWKKLPLITAFSAITYGLMNLTEFIWIFPFAFVLVVLFSAEFKKMAGMFLFLFLSAFSFFVLGWAAFFFPLILDFSSGIWYPFVYLLYPGVVLYLAYKIKVETLIDQKKFKTMFISVLAIIAYSIFDLLLTSYCTSMSDGKGSYTNPADFCVENNLEIYGFGSRVIAHMDRFELFFTSLIVSAVVFLIFVWLRRLQKS